MASSRKSVSDTDKLKMKEPVLLYLSLTDPAESETISGKKKNKEPKREQPLTLPYDIERQILLWTERDDLSKHASVSKAWEAILKSDAFKKEYQTRGGDWKNNRPRTIESIIRAHRREGTCKATIIKIMDTRVELRCNHITDYPIPDPWIVHSDDLIHVYDGQRFCFGCGIRSSEQMSVVAYCKVMLDDGERQWIKYLRPKVLEALLPQPLATIFHVDDNFIRFQHATMCFTIFHHDYSPLIIPFLHGRELLVKTAFDAENSLAPLYFLTITDAVGLGFCHDLPLQNRSDDCDGLFQDTRVIVDGV